MDCLFEDASSGSDSGAQKLADMALFMLSLRKATQELSEKWSEFHAMAEERVSLTGENFPWEAATQDELVKLVKADELAAEMLTTLSLP